jgi:cytochrome c1
VPVPIKRQPDPSSKHHDHSVYASETTGLLVIAFLLLILTLLRYWHDIHWSLR